MEEKYPNQWLGLKNITLQAQTPAHSIEEINEN